MIKLDRKIGGKDIVVESHDNMHFDEITALFLAEKFASHEFFDRYCPDGILRLGVEGGPFDEHPVNGEPLKSGNECCTTLIAKALGVIDDPALEKIIRFVINTDLKGAGQPFDLASVVKQLYQKNDSKPEEVIEWATVGLEAKYQEQLRFFGNARNEFLNKAEIEDVQGPGGRILKMVVIVSDEENVCKFARSSHGCNAAIVIQKQLSGNVQIYTNKQLRLVLFDTAQMIRLAEQEAKGQIIVDDWRELASEGKVEGAEEWYFHHGGQMLLNGSLTAKNVPPTKLTLNQIKDIIRVGINPNAFEPKRKIECERGICTSTFNDPCFWYRIGLMRCRQVRYKMHDES